MPEIILAQLAISLLTIAAHMCMILLAWVFFRSRTTPAKTIAGLVNKTEIAEQERNTAGTIGD